MTAWPVESGGFCGPLDAAIHAFEYSEKLSAAVVARGAWNGRVTPRLDNLCTDEALEPWLLDPACERSPRESCNRLVGTKHDLMTELFELTEPKMASVSDADIAERVARNVLQAFDAMRRATEGGQRAVRGESVPGVIEE